MPFDPLTACKSWALIVLPHLGAKRLLNRHVPIVQSRERVCDASLVGYD